MTPAGMTGALVIGGDHPGLGIVRSLGQRGIPVCVVDDQLSVSSFSRYTKRFVRVKDLRDERKTVETVLEVGRRFGLRGALRVFQSADPGLGYGKVGVEQEEYL